MKCNAVAILIRDRFKVGIARAAAEWREHFKVLLAQQVNNLRDRRGQEGGLSSRLLFYAHLHAALFRGTQNLFLHVGHEIGHINGAAAHLRGHSRG